MKRLLRFLYDIALIPRIWRELVLQARAGGLEAQVDAVLRAEREANIAYMRRSLDVINADHRQFS